MLQGFWLRLVNKLIDMPFRQPTYIYRFALFIKWFSKIEKMNGNIFPEPTVLRECALTLVLYPVRCQSAGEAVSGRWVRGADGQGSRERGRACASRVPGDVWISVGVLEPAQVLHAHRETNWVMMQNRGTMGNGVCVWVWFILFWSWTPHKRTGQWVVSFLTCWEEQEIVGCCVFILILVPLLFWGDFAYSCPIYSDPERESILVLSICKQLMMSEFGAEAHGSPGGHVFTGCLYSGELSSGASSGFTWNK